MSFEIIIPFLRPIQHLLESETVSEIMVNPDSSVWVEESGQIRSLRDIRFDDGALQTGLEVIANRFGKKLDVDSPILNLRLPDGSRMAAMIPPIVNPRPLMTVRRFTAKNFTLADLIETGMLTGEQALILTAAVREGKNILIAEATSTGKTTVANVLADAVPEQERILVIEDTAELRIRKPHVVSAESQLDTHRSQITFDDLLRAVLRHRPDRIIVGEVRGPEAHFTRRHEHRPSWNARHYPRQQRRRSHPSRRYVGDARQRRPEHRRNQRRCAARHRPHRVHSPGTGETSGS